MMDQHRTTVSENQDSCHSSGKSNRTPQDDSGSKNRPAGQVDIIAMIRSLQRAAGMTDCFKMGISDCDNIDCDWRTYCLGTPVNPKKNGKQTKQK